MEALKLVLLLVALLVPGKPVDAVCNKCVDSHTCVSETQFQICYDGVRNQSITYTCPESKPICTDFDIVCMPDSTGTPRGCGDVSKCGLCTGTNIFACTSLNTFAVCSDGEVFGNSYSCAEDYICSVTAAQGGNPCVTRCNMDDTDICDRVLETDDGDDVTTASTDSSTETSTTTTPIPDSSSTIITTETSPSTITTETSTGTTSTETSSSTITTETSAETTSSTDTSSDSTSDSTSEITSEITSESTSDSTSESTTAPTTTPPFNEVVYCQGLNSTGRYPIPNDTVCTSYIYCVFRGTSYVGILYNCPVDRPYFSTDINNCGTVRPTLAGCTN